MSKQSKSIQDKLLSRSPANMRQVIKPVDMLKEQPEQKEPTNEPNNERSDERTIEPTLKRSFVRKNERRKIRHTFDIYEDQLLTLKEISINRQKEHGNRVLLGDLVQEALDALIVNERKNVRTNERRK